MHTRQHSRNLSVRGVVRVLPRPSEQNYRKHTAGGILSRSLIQRQMQGIICRVQSHRWQCVRSPPVEGMMPRLLRSDQPDLMFTMHGATLRNHM
mmetsp:Transcript_30185/g.99885  ORF Transcript_30185/g.99885 Transcript_30185/m.99885 type:complete len:94 (-) Transcript_30185:700-981(-)